MLSLVAALAVAATSPVELKMNVLVFSKTAGFRHDSIPAGQEMFRELGRQNGFAVECTEDAGAFNDANLSRFQAVVFLNTTGNVLDADQQKAFEGFVAKKGGYIGIHAAADTEYEWPWYGDLVGGYFLSHPRIQEAEIRIEDKTHPTVKHWPETFRRNDEWYDYRVNPRPKVKVLATLNESTYEGGKMGADHPIVWCREFGGGRAWYTGFGHTKETYAEPNFQRMILAALDWVTYKK